MNPEAFNGLFGLCGFRSGQTNALNDAGEVPQIEQVVRLGWGRQEVLHRLFVQNHRAVDNL